MSIKTNKDNVYIMAPDGKYKGDAINVDWSGFMEKDFTVVASVKVLFDEMDEDKHGYMFSRNGAHSGLSVYVDGMKNIHLLCNYWFWKNIDNGEKLDPPELVEKKVTHIFSPDERFNMNNFIVRCDHNKREIYYYMNNNFLGKIEYSGLDKVSYKEAYMWLGASNMVTDVENQDVGNFEYDLFFCSDVCMTIDEIIDLRDNYEEKYCEEYFGSPILKKTTPHMDHIYYFMNFKEKTKYKLWNLCFNGIFANFYIHNNTMY